MQGENFVKLRGYLANPKFTYTGNGYPKFSGRLAVPIQYTKNGEQIETRIFFKIAAWNDYAEALNELVEGVPLEINGHLSDRSYDGVCKSCGAPEKKYWSEVIVDNFIVVVE